MGMRVHPLLRETLVDTRTGASRAGTFTLLSILVLVGLSWSESASIGALTAQARRFRDSGATIFVLEAPTGVSGHTCAALADLNDVRAAGAIRSGDPIHAGLLPASPIPVWEATAGILTVLSADIRGIGIVVGPGIREVFGRDVSAIVGAAGTVAVGGTYPYPNDGRWPGLDYAALAEVPPSGVFDQCWLQVDSGTVDPSAALFTALRPGFSADQLPELSQLNSSLGRSFDLDSELSRRTTRFAPLVALLIGLIAGSFATLSRRLHLASALHAGVTRFALAALCLLETAIWTIGSAFSVFVFTPVASLQIDLNHRQLLDLVSAEIGLLYIVGVASGTLASFGLIKERRLFAYFKGSG